MSMSLVRFTWAYYANNSHLQIRTFSGRNETAVTVAAMALGMEMRSASNWTRCCGCSSVTAPSRCVSTGVGAEVNGDSRSPLVLNLDATMEGRRKPQGKHLCRVLFQIVVYRIYGSTVKAREIEAPDRKVETELVILFQGMEFPHCPQVHTFGAAPANSGDNSIRTVQRH